MLNAAFRREGLAFDAVAECEEALRLVRLCEYAVILLDLMLPRLNGAEFLEAFRQCSPNTQTAVIRKTAVCVFGEHWRKASRNSAPLSRGSIRSSRMTAYSQSRTKRSASSHSATASKASPSRRNAALSMPRIPASSSTISTLGRACTPLRRCNSGTRFEFAGCGLRRHVVEVGRASATRDSKPVTVLYAYRTHRKAMPG